MKKKQRDDVMGEDESSLPVNDGQFGFVSEIHGRIADVLRYSAWWLPRVSIKEGILLPAADQEC